MAVLNDADLALGGVLERLFLRAAEDRDGHRRQHDEDHEHQQHFHQREAVPRFSDGCDGWHAIQLLEFEHMTQNSFILALTMCLRCDLVCEFY